MSDKTRKQCAKMEEERYKETTPPILRDKADYSKQATVIVGGGRVFQALFSADLTQSKSLRPTHQN